MLYATEAQIAEILGYRAEIIAYRAKFAEVMNTLAGYIEAYESTFPKPATVKTRYITSEGRDDELWRGNLLSASPDRKSVNLWLLTDTFQQGLPFSNDEAIGSFNKPTAIGIDYYYDYDYGTDIDNSEDFFKNKIRGFDYILEQIRTCLPNDAEVESWSFRLMIKKFTNASTHIAKGDLAIKFSGL